MDETDQSLLNYAVDVVTAHVANNPIAPGDVPAFLREVYSTLQELSGQKEAEAPRGEPAVPIKASIKRDYIICLEDGKKFKSLKRHLRTQYNMSPEDYREKWGLPADYPMVAPNYAQARSQLAKKMGLGQQRRKRR